MVDRLLFGEVLDFIVTPFRPGVFNIADVMIHVGMLLVILGSVVHKDDGGSETENASEIT